MFGRDTLIGKIFRLPFDLIPSESEVRILRGPLRGKKWVVGSSTHACWIGTYEVKQLQRFAAAIKPGDCIYDIGANVGVYSLSACEQGGASAKVYSFEPLERNLHYLRRHIALNNLHQCHVKNVAVSDRVGITRFSAVEWNSSMGRVSCEGELLVSTITLDDSIFQKKDMPPPNVIKIDVEGAEFSVLQGAAQTLRTYHPSLFVEIHGVQEHANCHNFLASLGYRLLDEYGSIVAVYDDVNNPS